VLQKATGAPADSLEPTVANGSGTGTHQLMRWGGGVLGALLGGVLASAAGLRAPFFGGAPA
jgi:hypothetical protein